MPGGHWTEYGIAIPTLTRPEEAQAWVDARLAEGSDYIKLVYSDTRVYGWRFNPPTLSKKTMTAVIAAAHARGKLAVVHIDSEQDARDAIEAGADGLAHLFVGPSVGKDFGTLVAAHHAFVVPTLSMRSSACDAVPVGAPLAGDKDLAAYMTAAQKHRVQTGRVQMSLQAGRVGGPPRVSCERAYKAIRLLRDAGVPVLVGSDAPNPGTAHGATVHGEMEELVPAGMTPMQVLAGATSRAADAFWLPDRGRIAVGKRADLVLVEGDPTGSIRDTRRIVAVWKAGVWVERRMPEGMGDGGRYPPPCLVLKS